MSAGCYSTGISDALFGRRDPARTPAAVLRQAAAGDGACRLVRAGSQLGNHLGHHLAEPVMAGIPVIGGVPERGDLDV